MRLQIWYKNDWWFCTTCKMFPEEYIRNIHFQFRKELKKAKEDER